MKAPPTDLKFLETIYEMYYGAFVDYREEPPSRSSKNYVPIDIHAVAVRFGIDSDLVFGRLYYDLNKRYGYEIPSPIRSGDKNAVTSSSRVDLFAMRVGGDRHCIHFPYLSGVVAGMRSEHRKFLIPTTVSAISASISMISAAVAVSSRLFS